MTKRVAPVLREIEESLASNFCLHSKVWLENGPLPSPLEGLCPEKQAEIVWSPRNSLWGL